MEELSLSKNKISNIDVLEKVNFKELKGLYLAHNNISDIKVLEKVNFKKLEKLYLNGNEISNLDILEIIDFRELKELQLSISYNSDKKVLEKLKNIYKNVYVDEQSEKIEKVNYELNTILAKMEAAKEAIRNMSPKSIAELKALKRETENTGTTLKLCAIIYLKVAKKITLQKCNWAKTRDAIMKRDFISTIINTKIEDLGDNVINIIKKEIKDPKNNWNIDKIKNAFKEVGLLAEWIESIIMYADISSQMKKSINNE